MLESTNNGYFASPAMTTLEEPIKLFPGIPSNPSTAGDARNWKGFCELESDPAYFNVMLQEFGVQGVKVQEVYGMDDAMLQMLSKPVHGLIFLFRWKDDSPDDQEPSCPEVVWFANQTSNNSCASVALLNIVNNIPNAELGPNLSQFKDFTREFSPALRGDQINSFEFVKRIHNSFAKKMDMLNADLVMKQNVAESAKAAKKKTNQTSADNGEASFHFIAYVPIQGTVWKLDGLERQPQRVGPYTNEELWMHLVGPVITQKMSEYEEDQIQFGLFAVVQDPLTRLGPELAENLRILREVEQKLEIIKPDWREFVTPTDVVESSQILGSLVGSDAAPKLAEDDAGQAQIPHEISQAMACGDVAVLLSFRVELITTRADLQMKIHEQEEDSRGDIARATARRHDYGPAIRAWVSALTSKDDFKGLVRDYQADAVDN